MGEGVSCLGISGLSEAPLISHLSQTLSKGKALCWHSWETPKPGAQAEYLGRTQTLPLKGTSPERIVPVPVRVPGLGEAENRSPNAPWRQTPQIPSGGPGIASLASCLGMIERIFQVLMLSFKSSFLRNPNASGYPQARPESLQLKSHPSPQVQKDVRCSITL